MKMWAVRQEDPVTRFFEDSVEPFVFAQCCTVQPECSRCICLAVGFLALLRCHPESLTIKHQVILRFPSIGRIRMKDKTII
jgi:hypothetical protein